MGSYQRQSCGTPGRVLLVEDDFLVRDALVGLLEENGIDTVAVADGEQALAALHDAARPFQAAVIDLCLPGRIDGNELAGTLLALGTGVVLISGDHWRLDSLERSGTEAVCLAKPFGVDQLLGCIAQSASACLRDA
jgi:CheY-like chemotaxis protein